MGRVRKLYPVFFLLDILLNDDNEKEQLAGNLQCSIDKNGFHGFNQRIQAQNTTNRHIKNDFSVFK